MIFNTNFSEERTVVENNYDATTLVDCVICSCTCSCTCDCPENTSNCHVGGETDKKAADHPYDTSAGAHKA
jgi:hypothetical protein